MSTTAKIEMQQEMRRWQVTETVLCIFSSHLILIFQRQQ